MPETLRSVVDRLCGEFVDLSQSEVIAMVYRCHRDIDIAPEAAVPEFVERLARQRLGVR